MDKKQNRKLSLNRETLRKLSMGDMGQVAGGAWRSSGGFTCGDHCSTRDYAAPTKCTDHDLEP